MQSSKGQNELWPSWRKYPAHRVVMFTEYQGSTAYFEKYGDVAGLNDVAPSAMTRCKKIVEVAHRAGLSSSLATPSWRLSKTQKNPVSLPWRLQKQLIKFNAPRPEQDHVFIRIGLNYGSGIVNRTMYSATFRQRRPRVESARSPSRS